MSTDENLGDFGILLGMVSGIRRIEPDAEITVISAELPGNRGWSDAQVARTQALGVRLLGTPAYARGRHDGRVVGWIARMIRTAAALGAARFAGHRARAIAHPEDRNTWDALANADIVLAKGGSYLYSNGKLRSRVFLWRMRYLLTLAAALGRAPALMGVTVGPLQSRGARRDVRATLARCRQVYVRESRSASYLAGIGLEVARASDMAFLLEPPIPAPSRTARPPVDRLDDPCCCRSPTPALPMSLDVGSPAVIRQTLTSLLESDPRLRIVLVVQVAADAEPSQAMVRDLSYPDDRLSIAHATHPDDLMLIYERATVLVATRLHSTIFAALAGTPSIHIVSDPHKGYGISEDLGLDRWCVAADELDHRSLTSLIIQLIADRDTVSPTVAERVPGLRHEAHAALADALCRAAEWRRVTPTRWRLVRDFAWVGSGTAVSRAASLVALLVVVHAVSHEQFAAYAFGWALYQIVSQLLSGFDLAYVDLTARAERAHDLDAVYLRMKTLGHGACSAVAASPSAG